MTPTKLLGASIILTATLATPVLAQDAGKRAPANGYSLVSQSSARGAFDQVNEPSYAGRKRDRFDPANTAGTVDKDPQVTGGEDVARRAPGG